MITLSKMGHAELVTRAERWLRNTFHCRIVFAEMKAYTAFGEIPDTIGWVNNRSILVECKSNRPDFLADSQKRCRGEKSLGSWRFYLTGPGIVMPGELPGGWGLYEVHGKKVIHKAGVKYQNAAQPPFESNKNSEIAMLLSAFRVGEEK